MKQLSSMTGFGRIDATAPDGQLQVEIRSVNHRYLDLSIRLPEGFRPLEQSLRECVSERIKRGKVDATLSLARTQSDGEKTQLNLERVQEIVGHLQTIAGQMDQTAPINPVDVMRSPGVIEERGIDPEANFEAATQAMLAAIDQLCDSRAKEGAKVHVMLEARCVDILKLVDEVQQRLPTVLDNIRAKLQQRVESLTTQVDQDRLEQELAIIAQKLDVSEELDRLISHISEVRATMDKDEPVGRRLDFLMQELNREANTLGSKSADTETTQAAVNLKVLIEQMREQVQNVE